MIYSARDILSTWEPKNFNVRSRDTASIVHYVLLDASWQRIIASGLPIHLTENIADRVT